MSNQQHAPSSHALQEDCKDLPQQIHSEQNETCVNESQSQVCNHNDGYSELGSLREGKN